MKIQNLFFLFSLVLCFIVAFFATREANAAVSEGAFELVYTAPEQTNLSAADLRDPISVWVELFDNAQKSIDFEQMYAVHKEGTPFDRVLEALERAGSRGVKIRMLLEERMLRASEEKTIARLKKIPGLELRMIEFSKITGEGINHSKFLVVDKKIAFVGSQNFDWRAFQHIQELGVKISDAKIVQQMQAIFNHDWQAQATLAKGGKVKKLQEKTQRGDYKANAYLVASPAGWNPKGVGDSEKELPALIAEAKKEIHIQLLDYYPLNRDKTYYAVIDNAIRTAQARKVKIKLLVSHWNQSKPGIDHLKSLSMLPGVEIKIATIPQAQEGFIPFARVIHSKYMVIDDGLAWIGTSNWTGGYLNTSRNLELVMRSEKFAKRLVELHEQLWNSSYAEKLDVNKEYAKPNKGGE